MRSVYRHFPLVLVHPHALAAAEAAECASVEGRFWEMHRLLFENQSALEPTDLLDYGRRVGLNNARYTVQMADHAYRPRVCVDVESGRASGVRSTPGFFVDGRFQDVSAGLRSLFDATAAAIGRK